MTILGLYKNDKLMDYGVVNRWEEYEYAGYDVRIIKGKRPALYRHAKAEFNALWKKLGIYQQKRLADIPVDDEMTIYEKLAMLKAELATIEAQRRKRNFTYVRRIKKESLWSRIKSEVTNLFTLQEVCYA